MAITIQQIWDLRAELDNAITTKQFDKIAEVKAKYKNLMMGEAGFYSKIFTCYNHAFTSNDDRQKHNFANMNTILRNIQSFEKKLVKGEDVSVKLKLPHSAPCLASEIWVIRAMYDTFLKQSKKMNLEPLKVQQNMILGQAVQDRLTTLLYMVQTDAFYDQIMPLLTEVKEGYKRAYGKDLPKTSYLLIAEEYMEK